MNYGDGIFASNNKDKEEFGMFGKTKLGRQQPQIRVYHHDFVTTHDEKKPMTRSLAPRCHGPCLYSS
jgi:hypothetical protein